MKAISLWQPWASAVALGSKRIETRSWATSYRGPLAIHAAKRKVLKELGYYSCCWNWGGALRGSMDVHDLPTRLPFGAIVAVAELVDVRPAGTFTGGELDTKRYPDGDFYKELSLYAWTERQMGDYSIGRFGWVLANVRDLKTPVSFRGAQGFFNVPDALVQE